MGEAIASLGSAVRRRRLVFPRQRAHPTDRGGIVTCDGRAGVYGLLYKFELKRVNLHSYTNTKYCAVSRRRVWLWSVRSDPTSDSDRAPAGRIAYSKVSSK